MYLVDSSVWIDFLNGKATAQVEFLHENIRADRQYVGDLILAEVLQGIDSDRQFRRILNIMSVLPQLKICNHAVAVQAARNYRELRALGITIRKTIDTLIATRCIVDGIPLLYSDRDFEPFRQHLGLMSAMEPA